MAQAFRTQNLRLLGNLFDKNNSLGAKGYSLHSTGDGTAWQADQNEASGILTGGVLSIGTGSTISVSAGSGQIYSRSVVGSEIVTTLTNVTWSAFTNVSLTYLSTKQFTYLYIDQFGALVQSDTAFSDEVFKSYIVIGIVVHLNSSTINAVINSQNAAYGDAHRLYELYNSFGPIKRTGLTISSNGANLKINRASGSALLIGSNYTTDQFEPDIATISSYTDVKFARVRANGSGGFTFDSNSGSLYTAIDPNNYDNGTGTLASVTAGYWTIQRFYLFPNIPDRLVNYYGVAVYASLADALTALPNENFNESPFTARDAVFVGYVIVKQGVTDLSSSSNAKFIQGGLSRSLSSSSASGGGSTVAALDDLSDVQISTPLGGQFLTYDYSTSLWKNRSYILDANNNELIKFPSAVTGAVNEITITNAATSVYPSISATGDDTNIGLNLISKGTGPVQINGKSISLAGNFTTLGAYSLSLTTTGSTSLTLPTSGTLATTSQIPTVNDNILTLAGSGGIGVSTSPTFTANASADKTITISINDAGITYAKIQNVTAGSVLGRISGTGSVQEIDGAGIASIISTNYVTNATNAANLIGGIAGKVPYQSGANTTAFTAAGTVGQVFLSGGTGSPTWANQSSLSVGTSNSVANALTIASPLTGTSYNGSAPITIGLQNATASLAGGVSTSAQTFGGDKTFNNNVIVTGDLTVNGTTVTVNTTTLAVKDKNIELGLVSVPSDTTADGGGITLKGSTDKTFNWVNATSSWTSSENLDLATGKTYRINNVAVLSATTLGSSVVNSSLTSVGTLTNLTVTNTITGSVSGSAGSLSGTYTFWGQSFNGTQNVSGNLTSVGNITGSSGITITAGGSNQNITLTPSGTGYTLLNGSVGIGNSTPNNKLTIQAGDNKDSGPIINLGGNAINQFESGRIRFTEVVTGATPYYEGAYLHYDGSNNLFHIGVHNASDALVASDTNAISIVRSSANVGIGTTNPSAKLDVIGGNISTDGEIYSLGGRLSLYRSAGASYIDWSNGQSLIFRTETSVGGSGASEKVRINTDGNVGIGTTNPISLLHVGAASTPTATATPTAIQLDNSFRNGVGGNTSLKFYLYKNSNESYGFGLNNAGGIEYHAGYSGGSASNHAFYTDTTEKVRINNAGNIGVGTTAPLNKLHIDGYTGIRISDAVGTNFRGIIFGATGSDTNEYSYIKWNPNSGEFRLYANTAGFGGFMSFYSNNAEAMRIASNGNVGIGTTSPVQKLELYGVVGNPATSGTAQNGMMRFSNTTDNAVFDIGIRGGGNGAWLQSTDKTSLAANYALLLNPNGGNVGIGNSSPSNKLAVSGSVSVGSGYNIAGPTNGLIIEGNVGVGTTSPNGKLTIVGDGSANTYSGVLRIADSATDKWGGISFPDSQSVTTAANNYYLIGRGTAYSDRVMSFHIPNAANYGSGNQPKFGFYSSGTDLLASIEASTGTSYFKGNVGIGTTLPTYKLDVNGTSRFTGDLLSNGNINITKAGAYLYLNSTNSDAELLWMTNGGPRWAMGMNVGDATENLNIYNYTTATINFSILKANGNVGIGSSNPAYKLDVSGTGRVGDAFFITTATTADAKIEIGTGRSGNGNSYIDLVGDATYTDYGLRLIRSNGGANTTSAIAHRGTGNLYITAVEAAAISLETSNTTRMTITSDGNVGIGTTAPSQKLEVVGGEIKAGRVDAINEGGQVSFGRSTDNATAWYIDVYGSTSTPTLRFIDVSNASVRMTINESGNVGIGVASGTNLLDVNGTARIRSISASASAATIFLTTDANGVLISRTAAQVRSDIGAGTGSGTVTSVTGTAPIASSGGTTPAISLNDSGVTYAKIQNVSATARVLGRITAGAGVVEELTGANIATIIDTNAVTNSTNAANVTIATDDTTNSSYYLYFGANASGNTPIKASTKIRYNPSTGAFSATTKSFRIPHPTKTEHDLVYGSLESPYHGIRLTGKGKTNGTCAEIILPDYVNTLIDENTVNIQITSYKCAKVFYIENINIKDNKFIVKYDKSWYEKAKDVEFFWDFTAERKDVPKLIVEEKL
jgi:hypothetical protein